MQAEADSFNIGCTWWRPIGICKELMGIMLSFEFKGIYFAFSLNIHPLIQLRGDDLKSQ